MAINVAPIKWDEQGQPYSVVFNDKYFCTENGYEEILHVSCQGNQLRERFTKLNPTTTGTFTIIETGFGTGLNFCCAWQLWQECAPASWTLHFISIELFPMAVEHLYRALGLWPMLATFQQELVAQYQPCAEGEVADLYFQQRKVRLTIVFDHVVTALSKIKKQGLAPQAADAWMLNGFAPFKNPEMWSDHVFAGMAALSAPGTTLATFTVAGFVRRGLEANGFAVEKITGHGLKKHILAGVFVAPK